MSGLDHLPPETADIFRRLDLLGLRQKDLADALGLEPNKISKVRNGERQFKGPELVKALVWLDDQDSTEVVLTANRVGEPAATYQVDAGEVAEVLQLDLSFSMGPGATIDDYVEEAPVKFDMGFLRQITRSPPHRLRLARGIGDSMFPTLLSSDRVMIDTTQQTLNLNDRIWALSLYGAAAIKRLRAVGQGRVLVMSDNPTVPDQEVDAAEVRLAGRVIWFSREV